jgi:hypothetical protein
MAYNPPVTHVHVARHRSAARAPAARLAFSALLLLAAAPARAGVDIVYVVPGSHLDIGYTELPSRVWERRISILDAVLDLAREDPDFFWFEEAGWSFDGWLERNRRDENRLALARRLLHQGRLAVGAAWCTPHAAAFPEALDLLTVHLDALERELGYRPQVAVLNDVPSFPEGVVDALAASGVRYLLIGANRSFSPPLPAPLSRRPFWWKSARGESVLVHVDPDGFTAGFHLWGLDPVAARAFNPDRFKPGADGLATMEQAVRAMLREVPDDYDAVIVQHAFDNWGPESAQRLAQWVRKWNEARKSPRLALAPPEVYFQHVEERYGASLPVLHGEWGGDWDLIRAGSPVWTWRLREAARALPPDATVEAKAALATAMEHNVHLGVVRDGFSEADHRDHARQCAELFARAVRSVLGEEGVRALPPLLPLPPGAPAESGLPLAADAKVARVRAGLAAAGALIAADAPELAAPIEAGAERGRLVIRIRLDRRTLPRSADGDARAVIEIPLAGAGAAIAPEGSAAALEGLWLGGRPPRFVVAPRGARLTLGGHRYRVSSPTVATWALVEEPATPRTVWLQGLLVWQSTRCRLKGGRVKVLPYEALFPGEPAELEASIQLETLPGTE